MNAILQSYDQRTVSVRTAEIQNQCTILSNQLVNSDYLKTGVSDVIDTELSQLSNIYNGRVLVIDDEFRIVEDTYDLEEGKTIISEDVVKCFRGEKPASYDRKSRYIEVAVPVKKGEEPVKGMILVSVSTDSLRDNVEALQSKARIATVAISIIGIFLSAIIGMLLVRPLKRMSQSIEEMAGGYGDNYLHENAYDETERISNAFNKLWDRYKVLDASREEFVANVSHELKTPLTSMKVLADSLLMQPDAPTELYREFMGDLSEEIERENKIINDLLDLVKLDKKGANLNIKSQDVNELVERILKRLQPLAEKSNIELVFESFRPVTAEIDEVKIALVITNLVENAIKYNKENGWVHVSLNADHKYFYLKVADSGIGIPKEDTDHIFERFSVWTNPILVRSAEPVLGFRLQEMRLSCTAVRSRSTVNRERERHLQSGSRLLISRGKGEKNEKIYQIISILLAVCLLTGIVGCSKKEQKADAKYTIYQINQSGTALVPKDYDGTGKSVDEEVKGMLSALQKCDDEVKAQAALPKR